MIYLATSENLEFLAIETCEAFVILLSIEWLERGFCWVEICVYKCQKLLAENGAVEGPCWWSKWRS